MRHLIYFFCLILMLTACRQHDSSKKDYSFFVAGHTYGHPTNFLKGVYPSFKAQFPFLNQDRSIKFGLLTGDVVARPSKEYWDAFQQDLKALNMPIHLAAGNHDRGEIFDSLYLPYYYFKEGNDLFIILNPTNWNIEGEQKEFLEEILKKESPTARNIFIFCHELIWWSPKNKFRNIEINYRPHYPGSSNYWEEIHPILSQLQQPTYIFAGDLGATKRVSPYMYYKEDNIHLIASGMGSGEKDNFIIVELNEKGNVGLKLMGFREREVFDLESLESFKIP